MGGPTVRSQITGIFLLSTTERKKKFQIIIALLFGGKQFSDMKVMNVTRQGQDMAGKRIITAATKKKSNL